MTFDGVQRARQLIASAIINCVPGLTADLTTPPWVVRSMNGVEVLGQRPLRLVIKADAVLVGSGIRIRDVVADPALAASLAVVDQALRRLDQLTPAPSTASQQPTAASRSAMIRRSAHFRPDMAVFAPNR